MPSLTLTPRGHLLFTAADDALQLSAALSRRLESAFARGSGHGLLELGAGEVGTVLPGEFSYWRDFAARFVTTVCTHPDLDAPLPAPAPGDLEPLAAAAPPMTGAEYLTAWVLETLWAETVAAFRSEVAESKVSIQEFLQQKNPAWHLVGRVHFILAENRKDDHAPFAFLATYTTQLSKHAVAQHLPLGRALSEYTGAANKPRLLSLLVPVQRAAAECPWLKAMVETGEIYHPLRWTPAEAFQLLTDVPRLEAAGVIVRVPTAWRANRPPRPQVTATVGGKPPSGLGTGALLDFKMGVSLDGEPLTNAEIEELLAASNGLHLMRGRWVEVDRDRLSRMLDEFRAVETAAAQDGLSFGEAMRLLAGAPVPGDIVAATAPDWSPVFSLVAWLALAAGGWSLDRVRAHWRAHVDGPTRESPWHLARCIALHYNCSAEVGGSFLEDQITVRMPTALGRALRQTSRRLGRRPSDVVRMALESFLHEAPRPDSKPADRVAHLLGSLSSGVPDLAERHREYVLAALKRAR